MTLRAAVLVPVASLLLACGAACAGSGAPIVQEVFANLNPWSTAPSASVGMTLQGIQDGAGRAMRIAFEFRGGAGFAAARRLEFVELPPNFALSFRIRGAAPVNNLEVKLLDPSGDNVWWVNRRNFEFPAEWKQITLRRKQFSFAWGPLGGGDPRRVGGIEFAITAGSGGKGTVDIADLRVVELPPDPATWPVPVARASSVADGHAASLALDGQPATSWRSAAGDATAALALDLGVARELGGVVVDWDVANHPAQYAVETSEDGASWTVQRAVRIAKPGRAYLAWGEPVWARWLRVTMEKSAGAAFEVHELAVQGGEFCAPNAVAFAMAKDARRGTFPRAFVGEQSYWTVVGTDGGPEKALFGEDGALEPGPESFSIEPFVRDDERFLSWADVKITHTLEDGALPLPIVAWEREGLRLEIAPFAADEGRHGLVYARYRLSNTAKTARHVQLALALRPLQVNPPTQFLNHPGGVATVRSIEAQDGRVQVNGQWTVVPLVPPYGFGATPFDRGDVVEFLRAGMVPDADGVLDEAERASGAFLFDAHLAAGATHEVALAIGRTGAPFPSPASAIPLQQLEQRRAAVIAGWRDKLGRTSFTLPPEMRDLADTIRANLGFILAQRVGPALHPGSRSYLRAWIRDGAMMNAALLRLGYPGPAREFAEWFAGYQFPDGKVPCCVDARGADPVPENDSHGQLLFAIADVVRYTGDREFARRLWPRVRAAVGALDALRGERRTDAYKADDRLVFYGLLPESISHEGYSDKAMHSYWDDFWGLRGIDDAVWLAGELGETDDAARWAAIRDEFRKDVHASVARTIAQHGIDYVPGCAEKGDFDPTSTTIALAPGNEQALLPQDALRRTFARYLEQVRSRRPGGTPWKDYTPYEWRSLGALVRLNERDAVQELVETFMADRRPAGWRQWAEVVRPDPRTPGFLGDVPHAWVASDFLRSILDVFAYERGDALVVAGGIPAAWVVKGKDVGVRNLGTPWGPLDLTVRGTRKGVRVTVGGLTRVPPGGVRIAWNGREVALEKIPGSVDIDSRQP